MRRTGQPGWKMAAPSEQVAAGGFGAWLEQRLEALGMDPEVYPAYIQGVLREEESPEERDEALLGILAAFLEEDSIEDVCLEIVTKWIEAQKLEAAQAKQEDEVEALASMMEKQAQMVVKPKEVSGAEQQRKAALLAQYANITDEEDEAEEKESAGPAAFQNPEKSLFKNTNLEDIVNARKHERDSMKEASQKKKEQDKQQRDKDKHAKQDRKDKEKKRTQKGERKR
ncbi:coiled-coil domain-containing protein 43 [Hyperolius riggenbachi]|uniref:coiled-coil domain-containing protein 43 n=1 Tax=Hyperolius riggenbachi TaxID=752182 RepID=UPI0035A37E71